MLITSRKVLAALAVGCVAFAATIPAQAQAAPAMREVLTEADLPVVDEVIARDDRYVVAGTLPNDDDTPVGNGAALLDTRTGTASRVEFPPDCEARGGKMFVGTRLLLSCPSGYAVFDAVSGRTEWGPTPLPPPTTALPQGFPWVPAGFGSWWIVYGDGLHFLNWRTGEARTGPAGPDLNDPGFKRLARPCAPFARSGGYASAERLSRGQLLVSNARGVFLGKCGGPKKLTRLSKGSATSSRSLVGGWTAWLPGTADCHRTLESYDLQSRRTTRWRSLPDSCTLDVVQTKYAVVVITPSETDQPGSSRFFMAKRPA